MERVLTAIVVLLAALLISVLVAGDRFTMQIQDEYTWFQISMMLAVLVLISGGVFASFKTNTAKAMQSVAIWLGIGCAFALLYRWMN